MPFILIPLGVAAAGLSYNYLKPTRNRKTDGGRPEPRRWSMFDAFDVRNGVAPVTKPANGPNHESAILYPIAPKRSDRAIQPLDRVLRSARAAEARYQVFIQQRFARMLTSKRYAHTKELAGADRVLEITEEQKKENRRLALSVLLSGTAVVTLVNPGFSIVCVPFYIVVIAYDYPEAYRDLKRKRISFRVLMACFGTGVLLTGHYLAGALMMVANGVLGKVEGASKDQAKRQLTNVFGQQPRMVWVESDGTEIEVPFDQIVAGERIRVRAGQPIPVDGEVVGGRGLVDQHRLTGESRPVAREAGEMVFASTLLLSGELLVEVQKAGRETMASELTRVLVRTTDHHLDMETKGMELAGRTMKPAFCVALLALPFLGGEKAVALLGTAMPGVDLLIAGPLTLLTFLNDAAERHILVKDGRSLELLQAVRHVVFDKTGTLTLEQPHVTAIYVQDGHSEHEVLTYAATAERHQAHPVARAILAAAQQRGVAVMTPDHASYEVGYGIQVTVPAPGGRAGAAQPIVVHAGSERFMNFKQIPIPETFASRRTESEGMGRSLILIAIGGELAGMIELAPTIRPEAKDVVKQLHRRGISVSIISGDQDEPTRSLAADLGIQEYHANVLPQRKAELIRKLQQGGRSVCFVGDGINDAIALKEAKVSISLVGATQVATDAAQIVLMNQSLESLPVLFDMTRDMEHNLRNSFRLSAGGGYALMASVLFLNANVTAVLFFGYLITAGVLANTMIPVMKRRKANLENSANQNSNLAGERFNPPPLIVNGAVGFADRLNGARPRVVDSVPSDVFVTV